MKVSVPVRPAAIARGASLALELDRLGVDILWLPELYGFDAVSAAGYLAAVTEHVQLGTSVVPVSSRSPALLAMTAAGIDALSNGRAILGLGASSPQVVEGFHGLPFDRPLGRMADTITICRQVWRREPLSTNLATYQIPLPAVPPAEARRPLALLDVPIRDRIPIFVAALGPRSVAQAAELADGWIPAIYWPERARELWGDALADGCARRRADLGSLEVVAGGRLALGRGLEGLRNDIRVSFARYVGGMGQGEHNFYFQVLCRYGFERAAREVAALTSEGHYEEAQAAVPAEIVDATSLVGDEGWVRDRIAAYHESGVTILNIEPVGPNPLEDVERVLECVRNMR